MSDTHIQTAAKHPTKASYLDQWAAPTMSSRRLARARVAPDFMAEPAFGKRLTWNSTLFLAND